MKTYKDVTAEIEKLKAKAESLRKSEMAGVIGRIKEAIEAYGLTAADLGLSAGAAPRGSKAAASTAPSSVGVGTGVGVAKYRDPASGKTWTGRGKPPLWIQGAKDRSAFLIGGASAPSGSADGGSAKKAGKGAKARGRAKAAAPTFGVPKYRDAATGKTWTGRGKPPNWIAGAKDRDAYLIEANAAGTS
jgi:DNA-binding protein H-NS